MILWHPLRPSWHKLNSDEASKNNPGLSRSWGIIRDSQGNFVRAFSYFIHINTSLFSKAKALMEGIKLAAHVGVQNLWI